MRNSIVILLLCVGFSYATTAQEVYNSSGKPGYHKKTKKNKGYDPSKLIIGGGLEADFGGGYAYAGISPIVGYKFTNHFAAGVGFGYLYNQLPYYLYGDPNTYYEKDNIIYPNLWARYFVWRGLYISTSLEYDIIFRSAEDQDPITGGIITYRDQFNSESFLGGVGIKQPLGGRASVFVELMYDFLQQPNSPYFQQPPMVRAGIAVGL